MTKAAATRKATTASPRPTRGRGAAAEAEPDTKDELQEAAEESEVMETDAAGEEDEEELNDELLDDPSEEHAEVDEEEVPEEGDEEHEEEEEHPDENGHDEQHDDGAEAADTSIEAESKEETADASEKKETTEGESEESKTKEGETAAKDDKTEKDAHGARRERRIMVSAFFELEKFEDAAELAPFVKNCSRLNIRMTGKAATDKAVDVSMYYESEHYKEDLKVLRELKIRGKAVDKLVIRGEPVVPPAQVIVNNIPEDTTDDLLQMLFPKAKKITLPKTKDGKNKGCAMLVFTSREDAEECIAENAGINIEENTLTMEISKKEDSDDSRKRSSSHTSGSRTQDTSKRPRYDAHRSAGVRSYGGHASGSRNMPSERQNSGMAAQKMAGDMARKMHQMQERMTERIITQVASQIGLDQRDKRGGGGETDRWGADRRQQQYQSRGRDEPMRRSQGYGGTSGSYGNARRRGGLSADMY